MSWHPAPRQAGSALLGSSSAHSSRRALSTRARLLAPTLRPASRQPHGAAATTPAWSASPSAPAPVATGPEPSRGSHTTPACAPAEVAPAWTAGPLAAEVAPWPRPRPPAVPEHERTARPGPPRWTAGRAAAPPDGAATACRGPPSCMCVQVVFCCVVVFVVFVVFCCVLLCFSCVKPVFKNVADVSGRVHMCSRMSQTCRVGCICVPEHWCRVGSGACVGGRGGRVQRLTAWSVSQGPLRLGRF